MYILYYKGGMVVADSAVAAISMVERAGYSVASGEAAAVGVEYANGVAKTYEEFSSLKDARDIYNDGRNLVEDTSIENAEAIAKTATSVAVGGIAAEVVAAGLVTPFAPVIVVGVGIWFGAEAEDFWNALNELSRAMPEGWAAKLFDDVANGFLNLVLPDGMTPADRGRVHIMEELQSKFTQAEVTRSPLVLDLNGDGIVGTVGQDAGVHFDHDGNGFAELTGWADAADGILVMDRNGNGQIDDGSELFGNHTRLADGTVAANGFAALSDYDSDHDGDVDAQDADFGGLRVWRDLNSNGISEAGELLTLEEAGVQSLNVSYTNASGADANGNQHKQEGSYTRSDGSVAGMDDVWFTKDGARTEDKDLVEVSAEIAALPEVAGFGNVHSLRQASNDVFYQKNA